MNICLQNIFFLRFLYYQMYRLCARQKFKVVLMSQSMMENPNSASYGYIITISTVFYCFPLPSLSSLTTFSCSFTSFPLSFCYHYFITSCFFHLSSSHLLPLSNTFITSILFTCSVASFVSFSPLILKAVHEDRDVHKENSCLPRGTCWTATTASSETIILSVLFMLFQTLILCPTSLLSFFI